MPMSSFEKDSGDTILLKAGGDKRIQTLHKGVSRKGNLIMRLQFELPFHDVAVQHASHCISYSY